MNEKRYPEATAVGIGLIIVTIVVFIIIKNTSFTLDSYNQFRAISSIISLILRITIIIWIVNMAKEMERDKFGWGAFAFFLPSIALIFIGQKKGKVINQNNEKKHTSTLDNNEKTLIKDDIKNFSEQKNILEELKTNGIISDSEYENKLKLIIDNEDRIIEQEKNELIKIKVNQRIEPFIKKLSELTKLNILSNEEFELKKDELIRKYTKIVQSENDTSTIDSNYDIEKISKYDLTGVEIMGVTRLETKLTEGDMILKSKETKIINIYSKNDLNEIVSNGQINFYYLIEL